MIALNIGSIRVLWGSTDHGQTRKVFIRRTEQNRNACQYIPEAVWSLIRRSYAGERWRRARNSREKCRESVSPLLHPLISHRVEGGSIHVTMKDWYVGSGCAVVLYSSHFTSIWWDDWTKWSARGNSCRIVGLFLGAYRKTNRRRERRALSDLWESSKKTR